MTTPEALEALLRKYWGYDHFRGIQQDIIESICAGQDTLGLMPTGGGKSVTFQVPALALPGICIVVTPLIALMKDQVDHLRRQGIKALAIYSGMSREEIVTTLENCIFGQVKLLYVSPERLASDLFQVKVKKMNVSFITVDEAHCISQWGYDFRPAYLEIGKLRDLLKPQAQQRHIPILALTATATPAVVTDIQERLRFARENVFRMSFARQNLTYVVRKTGDKQAELMHILRRTGGCAIVYVRSRKRAKDISELLCQNGLPATYYHAGIDPAVKDQRQEDWQHDRVRIMVATNAFGMGIDKPDVRVVIHSDCPSSIEAYFQEAGRAGRDGKQAYAVLLYNSSDQQKLLKRIADTFPEKDYVKTVYNHLAYFYQIGTGSGYGHTFELNMDRFCTAFHHHPIRVNAALAILQRAGYIEYEPDPDTAARVKFILSRNELYQLSNATGWENAVITALLRCYGGLFVDYVYVDESYVAQEAGLDKNQVYQTLKALSQKRIIDFVPRKSIPLISYTRDREDEDRMVISEEVYENRRQQFEQRIQAVIAYAANDGECRSRQLLRYFGEQRAEDCGQCDVCRAKGKDYLSARQVGPARAYIQTWLADGQPHHISELWQAPMDIKLVQAALKQMADEAEIDIVGGRISKA